MFSLICARINDWVNNREAGDLRRYRGHYDVIVMGELYDWPRCHLGATEATLTNADKYDLNQTKTESKSTTKLTITESCVYFFKYTVWDSKAVGNRLYPEIKMSILQHECGISILNTLEIPQSCIKSYITETKTRCGPLLLLGVYKTPEKACRLMSLHGLLPLYPKRLHDDVTKWKHFSRYWLFVRESTGYRWILLTKASDKRL